MEEPLQVMPKSVAFWLCPVIIKNCGGSCYCCQLCNSLKILLMRLDWVSASLSWSHSHIWIYPIFFGTLGQSIAGYVGVFVGGSTMGAVGSILVYSLEHGNACAAKNHGILHCPVAHFNHLQGGDHGCTIPVDLMHFTLSNKLCCQYAKAAVPMMSLRSQSCKLVLTFQSAITKCQLSW